MTEQAMLDNQIVPAPQSEGGELPVIDPVEAYPDIHEPGNEQIAAAARELLNGVEVAPGAWERPGAKALAVAAAEWTHRLLSDMTGVTRESTAFAVKELQAQGLVRYPRLYVIEIKYNKLGG